MSSAKEQRKKRLTDKQQAIVDIVVTTIEALVVVVCIVVSVMVWVGVSDPANRSFNWFAIQTDSMMGNNADSVDPGDLMFTKKVGAIEDLKVGDVIAFKGSVIDSAGNKLDNQIITHRILTIDYAKNKIETRGDNADDRDYELKEFEDVIGVYVGKWKGMGKITLWLGGYNKVVTNQSKYDDPNQLGGYGYERSGSTATFLVIIIPLALLFVYNGYVVIKWVLDERAKKIRAAALAEAQENAQSQEEAKRQMLVDFMKQNGMSDEQIEAYFAQQEAAKSAAAAQQAAAEPQEDVPQAEQPAEENTADKPEGDQD